MWDEIAYPLKNFNGAAVISLRPSNAYMRQLDNHHWLR